MQKDLIFKFSSILFLFVQIKALAYEQPITGTLPDSSASSFKIMSEPAANNFRQITWHSMITDVPSDYSNFVIKSFRTQEIPDFITIGTLTGSLLLVDETTWRNTRIYYKKSQNFRNISGIAVKMGDGRYQFLAAALFAIPGVIFHNETAYKTGSNLAEAVITTGLLVQVLKRISGRESPAAATMKGGDWDPFPSIKQYQQHQPEYYSFPSGHLSTATAVLTVIANNYPDQKWIRPVEYPLLAVLGASLVAKGMHWYSDLPLAYFIGYSFGNIITPKNTLLDQGDKKTSLVIAPSINFNGVQLGMNFIF
jgi:membrane-associated phospholipid phosphatase